MTGPEKKYEMKIRKFLDGLGAWHLKTFSSGVQRAGIPDLLCCVNGYFVAIEVKAENGRPTPLQMWNIDKIREAGGVAMVLYPDGFDDFKRLMIKLSEVKK